MDTRTNIVIDDELIAQAMVRARVKTKKAAVEAALKAFVRKPDYSGLLALRGSGALADDYDPDECYKQYPVEPLFAAEPHGAKLTEMTQVQAKPLKKKAPKS